MHLYNVESLCWYILARIELFEPQKLNKHFIVMDFSSRSCKLVHFHFPNEQTTCFMFISLAMCFIGLVC